MNISVVGYGYWGKNLVRNFDDLGMLYAVCDWDHSRREIAAQKYPDARFYSEYDEVLADAAVDAVVLATPAVSHFEMARQAFQAGKDLYVEKPLAMNVQEGRELQEMAEENDCILMVGHILRYHPAVMKLEELVRQGALGQVRYLYSNRLNMGKIRTEENILWSFAPHDISVMLAISGEEPSRVSCGGGSYVSEDVADVTVSQFVFPGGLRAHIYVSWLHPFKEQRLVVIGSEKMAVFDDTAEQKLVLYPHKVEWKDHLPSAVKAEGEVVAIDDGEPLRRECQHFIDCVENHTTPRTDATESIRVLKVLDACQRSLKQNGTPESLPIEGAAEKRGYYVHPTAEVDDGCEIGEGTSVWHFSHLRNDAHIGENCTIGQSVVIGPDVKIGDGCKIQNNVSVYKGVTLEDHVFCGPSCVFTNVVNPRSEISRMDEIRPTLVKRGATIGANATVICGNTIGRYAFVGAGAVVTGDIPAFSMVWGNPAEHKGWVCACAASMLDFAEDGKAKCPECGRQYVLDEGLVSESETK